MKIGLVDIIKLFTNNTAVPKAYLGASVVYEEQSSYNKIYYTTSDGQAITPTSDVCSSITMTSNIYGDGIGCMTFDGNVSYIGVNAFNGCTGLTSIVLPNTPYLLIYDNAFANCSNLVSLDLGGGVGTINDNAFISCSSLTSLTIPSSVSHIRFYSFKDCSSLERIDCLGTTPPILSTYEVVGGHWFANAFAGTSCPIYVANLANYQNETSWDKYESRLRQR